MAIYLHSIGVYYTTKALQSALYCAIDRKDFEMAKALHLIGGDYNGYFINDHDKNDLEIKRFLKSVIT